MGCFGFLGGSQSASTKSSLCCISLYRRCIKRAGPETDESASAVLSRLLSESQKLAWLNLPSGSAEQTAKILTVITTLEKLVDEAGQTPQLPDGSERQSLFVEDQVQWQSVYPDGGLLLKRQMCMATTDIADMSGGCLFISNLGLVFDAGAAMDSLSSTRQDDALYTDFLPWGDIITVEKKTSNDNYLHVTITVHGDKDYAFSALQLQLTYADDFEWIEQFWKLTQQPGEFSYLAYYTQLLTAALPGRKMLGAQQSATGTVLGRRHRAKTNESFLPGKKKNTVTSSVSVNFKNVPGLPKPDTTVPKARAPIYTKIIPGMTIKQVREAMEQNEFVPDYLVYGFKAYALDCTEWSPSRSVEGAKVRKVFFKIPLDDLVPAQARRLITIPECSPSTNIIRLRASDDEVVQSQQNFAHDIPFCNDFLLSETVTFTPHASGGVEFKKYGEVVWLSQLPFLMRSLQPLAETIMAAESKNAGVKLIEFIEKLAVSGGTSKTLAKPPPLDSSISGATTSGTSNVELHSNRGISTPAYSQHTEERRSTESKSVNFEGVPDDSQNARGDAKGCWFCVARQKAT